MITQAVPRPADPTAVVGRRIVAYLIDATLAVVLLVVVFASVSSSAERPSANDAEAICDVLNNTDSGYFCINADTTVILTEDSDMVTLGLVLLAYIVATQLVLPSLTGFSPGKAIVGLRVVKADTFARAGFGPNLIRWLLWIVDSAPWCFPLVGLITGLSSNGHRRVGDMAAGTLVIDRKWVDNPLPVPGVNSVVASAPPPVSATAPPLLGDIAPPAPGTPIGVPATAPPPTSPSPTAPPLASPPPPGATPPPPFGTAAPPPTPAGEPEPPPEPAPDPAADTDATTALVEPLSQPPVAPPPPTAPVEDRPGVDAPQWDEARDTYIQWDPELSEWMEWSEATGAWIPISQ